MQHKPQIRRKRSVGSQKAPSYRRHRATGRAVVTLNGRDHYLGEHGTAVSRAAYDELIAKWLHNGRRLPDESAEEVGFSVNEVALGFLKDCEQRFANRRSGRKGMYRVKLAIKPLKRLFGRERAAEFGPRSLVRVRDELVSYGYARTTVNEYVCIVKDVFRWAVRDEMLAPIVYHALSAVTGLRSGDSTAPEPQKVMPVPAEHVAAVLPHVSRQVVGMIELQLATGMRPGEAVIMRGCDLDTTGKLWSFVPKFHKTEHMGRERTVVIGPRGREIIERFLKADLQDYLFSPIAAAAERSEARRRKRKTKVQPSQRGRTKRRPKRTPGERYTTASYAYAIRRACIKNKVPVWAPNQLRHSFATRVRKSYGLEASAVILGHGSAKLADAAYAERDQARSVEILAKIG